MSEAMSSGEIEDVLSSIRRLVSEDLRPTSSSGGKPAARLSDAPAAPLPLSRIVAAETPTPEPKKLLLTPALRVVPAAPAPETAPQPPAAPPRSADLTGVSEDPESVEDDGLFGAIDLKPRTPKQDMTEVVSTIATAVADADSQWESETGDASFEGLDWEPPLWEEDPAPTMAEARPRSLLAAAQPPVSEPPPSQEAHSPFTETDALEEAPDDLAEDLTAATPEPEQDALPAEEWEDAEASDPALADTLAAPQFSRRFVQDVSDRAEAEAVAEILRATQAEAEARVEPQDYRSDFGGEYESDRGADGDHPDNQGGYFDEAVLRDLVRDLIREELSGTLGERITRNVRKLVRAEIHRSLTARDFE
jgi:hypothetical protein